jgi:hypothetical protein
MNLRIALEAIESEDLVFEDSNRARGFGGLPATRVNDDLDAGLRKAPLP